MGSVIIQANPPQWGTFSIDIRRTFDIQVSQAAAQKAVTRYVVLHLSSQMHGREPTLFVDQDKAYWRVPVHLTFPSQGDVGRVGAIDVDVLSGEVHITDELVEELEARATYLAERFTRLADR